jgi:fumarate reductase flavoprotein subunit
VAAQVRDETRRQAALIGDRGTERVSVLREQMQTTMEEAAGIYRTGPGMAKGAAALAELQGRMQGVRVSDTSKAFNTELVAALELANMLDVAETMLVSGLQREESRGAHQRTDFPARDDERFLSHVLVHREPDGSARVEQQPVTITRGPPGERKSGR